MEYYSAQILVVCLVDDGKPRKTYTCDHQIFIIRARNYDVAFAKAVELGRETETTYSNAKGQRVRWAFVCVDTIWRLGRKLDRCEVGSVFGTAQSPKPIPFKKRFRPVNALPLEM